MKKRLVFILFFFWAATYQQYAQSISPFVINTAGGAGEVNGTHLYFNIGETMISTVTNSTLTITQGFLQPDKFNLLGTPKTYPVSCIGKNDGMIILNLAHTGLAPQALSYEIWWNDTSLCPAKNCDTLKNLPPGTYSVSIIAYNGTNPIDTLALNPLSISPSAEPCKIKPFTYISPNNDGQNDGFYIENIEEYPDNEVHIFNRWGQEIVHIKGYNNQNKLWGSTDHPINVPSGTYYYLIDLDGKGKNIVKGFIELIKD